MLEPPARKERQGRPQKKQRKQGQRPLVPGQAEGIGGNGASQSVTQEAVDEFDGIEEASASEAVNIVPSSVAAHKKRKARRANWVYVVDTL